MYAEFRTRNRQFQSTPSVGRATVKLINKVIDFIISIHALRGEGDCLISFVLAFPQISIHALRGEGDVTVLRSVFAFTVISIHALRGEGDSMTSFLLIYQCDFNPRPPWGGRPERATTGITIDKISIHALRGEGDCKNIQICNAMLVHSAYKTVYFCDSCAFYLT